MSSTMPVSSGRNLRSKVSPVAQITKSKTKLCRLVVIAMNKETGPALRTLKSMARRRLIMHVEIPRDIPANAIAERRVMRENRREGEPAMRVDNRQRWPAKTDVHSGGARIQRHQSRIKCRAAVTENAYSLIFKAGEIHWPVRMG